MRDEGMAGSCKWLCHRPHRCDGAHRHFHRHVEAFFGGVRTMLSSPTGHQQRDVWLRYARWLVAGLTFQLAADILETSIAPGWDDIGRVAAIAVIRTALNYFLERDLEDVRVRQRQQPVE